MPNWCCANVEISATEKEIKRLKKAVKDGNKKGAQKGLLNALVPQPVFENEDDWYNWNTTNWGCKWEASYVTLTENSKTSVSLTFDTAWGPALQAFETWADGGEGEFTYTYKYYEPGMAFCGEATHDGTCSFDEHVSANDDPERYREIARDEWGDEPWDDDDEEDEEDEDEITESEDTESELKQALESLKAEFDLLVVNEQDPVYNYLKEDIERLTQRVKAYGENNG
jgi:hypothetical protein